MKVAIIGAGSIVFCKTLMLDIMHTPGLEDTEFALMAPSTRRTTQVEAFAERVIKRNNLKAKAYKTTSQREALKGADFVISTFQIGGNTAYGHDIMVPMKYGVNQCIGDTLGPGGIMRAVRSIPTTMQLANDMLELCPDALLLNYVNPMAMICWALGTTPVKYVGLCHGVQTTLDLISGYTDVPKAEIDYLCAGINHMGWFLRLEHDGHDLYPLLRERFELPEYYANEKVRGEVFRHFGYFMTESTGHLSEYLPYFRKNQAALDAYCDEPGFGGEFAAYYNFGVDVANKYDNRDLLAGESTELPPRSVEYCSYIIEAIATGKRFEFNGNLRNDGMITNLPADCTAEGPVYADRLGLHRTIVGDLPPQCAALNLTNINVQRMAVLAGLQGDPEALMQAIALDPLTASVLTLREIREMTTDLLEAEREWLPQFEGKTLRATPAIVVPEGIERARVPVDPALAINARFGELAKE
ncbi:MAG: alpha-galactosidase [Chloroflexi bacterium]|nr:alpha-galactosidase [Chloroflexota bacterium]